MPEIDLEPHEYRRDDERRGNLLLLVFFAGFTLFALWVSGMLFNWRGWAVAFFAAAFGFTLLGAFPRYWSQRDR